MWVGGAAKDPVEEAEEKVEHAFSTLLERDPSFRACRRTLLTLDDGSIGEERGPSLRRLAHMLHSRRCGERGRMTVSSFLVPSS